MTITVADLKRKRELLLRPKPMDPLAALLPLLARIEHNTELSSRAPAQVPG